ncbi:hypothetical protein TYRP_017340 [Tyrophagus putrescentiae]|nr:hypothetical protein TYRP_017340 [Tyrophagus putrescentiae]
MLPKLPPLSISGRVIILEDSEAMGSPSRVGRMSLGSSPSTRNGCIAFSMHSRPLDLGNLQSEQKYSMGKTTSSCCKLGKCRRMDRWLKMRWLNSTISSS